MELSEIFSLFVSGLPAGFFLAAIVWVIGDVVAWAIRTMKT